MTTLDDYIEAHISPEPSWLQTINRDTNIELLNPRMCSGHLQGRLLKMLTQMIRPRRVLELGTYSGYSALCIAEGLQGEDAEIHTIEIDDELEDFITSHLARSPYASKVHLHFGDALKLIPELSDEPWDMVFMDADKRLYCQYFELLLPRLAPGAFILADNTLWGGNVVDPGHNRDNQTTGVKRFNDLVASHPAVETVILPLRDGLTLLRKK